jgi:hypothetical protein
VLEIVYTSLLVVSVAVFTLASAYFAVRLYKSQA